MERPTRWTRTPFRGSLAVGLGLLTKGELRGSNFRRLRPDVYVGAEAEVDVEVRVRALSCWSRERGIVAGPLAALAYGAECPWEDAEIVLDQHCAAPPSGVTTRADRLPDDEVTTRFGARVTTPLRTAFDLARRTPLVEAVAAVDAIAHVTRFEAPRLARIVDRHPHVRGSVQARRVLELMDRRAESLPETRLRLGLLERGVPPATLQWPVRLPNGFGKRLDLAWVDRLLALEYDGDEHRSITGQNRDAFDRARLGDLGWDVGVVTSAMTEDPMAFDELAARVLRKLG